MWEQSQAPFRERLRQESNSYRCRSLSLFRAGCTLVVSGDGRYYSKPAIATILRMAAANGVGKVCYVLPPSLEAS